MQDKDEKIRQKFRSIDELKKDFDKMNMNMKTDVEILIGLFKEYNSSTIETERKVTLLMDIEYYVHQVWFTLRYYYIQNIINNIKY